MFATLEQITSEEVKKLRNLALNPNRGDYVDRHGIPIDSNDIAYVIATPIQNSKRESGLEFSLTMWERTAHPRDVASSKKHMEVEKTNGSIHIGLHDDAGIQSIERFRYTLGSEIVSLQDFLDADSLLVGYIHPASEGAGSGIASIVIPSKQDSATGKVIRFYYGDASVAPIRKDAEEKHSYVVPEQYAAPKSITRTDYVPPEKYRNVNLSPGEITGALGLGRRTKKGFKFLREIAYIFSGETSAKRAPFEKIIEALNKKGVLTDEVITNLEEIAETALSKDVSIAPRKNRIYHTVPDINNYESILKHPEAPLPDIKTIAYILGISPNGVKTNFFYFHPWSKKDGTLKALEIYLHFRAQNSRNKNASTLQLQLRWGLEKLQAYEDEKLSGIPLVVGAEPNIGAVATPRVTEDSAPAIIGTNGGALEQRVERFPVTGNVIPPAGEGKIEAAPPVKTVYYYSSSADSEFGRALVAGHIKEGTFIYHSTFNEVGTVKNLYYKDGMPNTISAVFTGNGQRILIVNLNEPDRFNIAPIPKGILLPNGEEYEGDGNDGLHPMDYILGREYNPTQIYRWISFGESKLDYNGILQVLAKEDILVPGPNGNYTGENLARFAIIREKDFFFRRLGYEGSKKEVLMNAGRDLDERVKGSSKRQL